MPARARRRSISFRIWSWMVTSSAVVGSSASSSCGSGGERDGDHRALAHAAGELVRVIVEPRARRRGCRPGPAARSPRARAAARRRSRRWAARLSVDLQPDRQHRIERRHRLLEDRWRSPRRARARSSRSARRSRSRPRQRTWPLTARAGAAAAEDGAQRDALAGAGFADEAEHLARRRRRGSTPSTAGTMPARSEADAAGRAPTDRACAHSSRRRMPGRSARPSPSQAEADAGEDDGDAGEDRHPPGRGHEVLAVGDQHAPFGRRRLRAEAEIAEARAEQDRQRHVGHPIDEDRRMALGRRWRKMMRGGAIAHARGRRRRSRAASAPSPRRASAGRRTPSRRR